MKGIMLLDVAVRSGLKGADDCVLSVTSLLVLTDDPVRLVRSDFCLINLEVRVTGSDESVFTPENNNIFFVPPPRLVASQIISLTTY